VAGLERVKTLGCGRQGARPQGEAPSDDDIETFVSALVIDTSSWIAFFREGSDDAIIEPALEEGTVYLPPFVAAELLSGRMAERARGELEDFC